MGMLARFRRWFRRPVVDRGTEGEAAAVAEQRDTTRGWYGGAPIAKPLDTHDRPPK